MEVTTITTQITDVITWRVEPDLTTKYRITAVRMVAFAREHGMDPATLATAIRTEATLNRSDDA